MPTLQKVGNSKMRMVKSWNQGASGNTYSSKPLKIENTMSRSCNGLPSQNTIAIAGKRKYLRENNEASIFQVVSTRSTPTTFTIS